VRCITGTIDRSNSFCETVTKKDALATLPLSRDRHCKIEVTATISCFTFSPIGIALIAFFLRKMAVRTWQSYPNMFFQKHRKLNS
jgi:hypothetical protein